MQKLLLSWLFICCFTIMGYAHQSEQDINTKIEEVKVHLRGAEIIRTKKITLAAGKESLVFSGLSPRLNASTIVATATNGATILSVTSKTNFLKKQPTSAYIKTLRDSLEIIEIARQDLNDELKSLASDEQVINQNKNIIGKDKGFGADDMIKMSEYYSSRLKEIYKTRTKVNRQLKKLNIRTTDINRQLQELNAQNTYTSEIYLSVNAKSSVTTEIMLRYIIDDAGWSPIYDLKAGELNEPIKLKYRALAFNNSGVDWEDVKITLSTADPYQSANQPILTPWKLTNTVSIANSFARSQGILNRSNVMQQEILAEGDFITSPQPGTTTSGITFETIDIAELNKDFDITDPYSIPSDRKPYSIEVTEFELKANYKHYVVPKMDKDAFLLAQITGWEELDLISGPMNVYHNDTYIGLANINTASLDDTLELSLGRDKNVVVTRTKLKELSKKQFLGDSRKASYGYRIKVKNNHRYPIDLEIQDQVPISNTKEIEVTVKGISGATHYQNTGKLVWKFSDIPTGDTKSVDFGFEVKHPKTMQIQLQKQRKVVTPRYY